MMATETVNSIDYKELYAQYNWFANHYSPAIQTASDEFFLTGLQFVLLGISKNINTLMDKDAYFVTKVKIDEFYDMFFRVSEKSVGLILEKALGKPDTRFNLNRVTDLEAKIITAFNDYVYNAISKILVSPPPTVKRANFDLIHLTFLVKDVEKNVCGKFIFTLPEILLNPQVVECSGDKFDYDDFLDSKIDVNILLGTTKIRVLDLKNIDVDDIVVFDNSDIKHMVVKFKNYEKKIKVNPNLGLILPFDNDGGEDEMAENTNLWDSIEVEMKAQFDTIKITLGELKNIEEGLVVDLTSIYDNKVTLSVEDKVIARGELVIVNDRYGVKIEEVTAKGASSKPVETVPEVSDNTEEEPQQVDTPEEVPQQQETSDEDEFDYSDFELEDEDI
jgi:flagellar motor switch/type III secretory pathway protein FliN